MTYRIVAELTDNQISELMELYKNEFWSRDRTRQDVVKMLAASDIIIGLVDDCDRRRNLFIVGGYFFCKW